MVIRIPLHKSVELIKALRDHVRKYEGHLKELQPLVGVLNVFCRAVKSDICLHVL